MIVFGLWFALAGGIALLAGMTAARRARRLREEGTSAWGLVVAAPAPDNPDEPRRRPLIQYRLADGRTLQRLCPGSVRRSRQLAPGDRVLVCYDPADPDETVVYGRESKNSDRAFVLVGLLFVFLGVWLAGGGH
jgi:hypothetical protein